MPFSTNVWENIDINFANTWNVYLRSKNFPVKGFLKFENIFLNLSAMN